MLELEVRVNGFAGILGFAARLTVGGWPLGLASVLPTSGEGLPEEGLLLSAACIRAVMRASRPGVVARLTFRL